MAEEEGIEPPVALLGARQFSGLVTLPTRPLLRARKDRPQRPMACPTQNLERRRGFEPRPPGLRPGRSPLAVAAHWWGRRRSNPRLRLFRPLLHHLSYFPMAPRG